MKRLLAIVVCATLIAPAPAFAQAPKAGVVTTVDGNVTARRQALPDPVPLKYTDDVFQHDKVTTAEKSRARMLLGGKAVVTMGECSVLNITEISGRLTIELETGTFALAVARERMRPGEEIQIRTPNAIAAVRGNVVFTEVTPLPARAGARGPHVVTKVYVLKGSIHAQQLAPTTGQPVGAQLTVGELEAYSGSDTAAPTVASFEPEQAAQIISGQGWPPRHSRC